LIALTAMVAIGFESFGFLNLRLLN